MVSGGVLLTDSIARLLLVYLMPADAAAGLSTALNVGAVALLVCWALWHRRRRHRAVAASLSARLARGDAS